MATYRMAVSIISRRVGRTATAAAAYRAAANVVDERTGERFDYTRRGGLLHSEIVVPANAPDWGRDRAELWNRSELADKRQDAQVAREILLSLPHELTDQQRTDVTKEFARHITERYGLAVDVNIHAAHRRGDDRNHHAHLLLCTRPFDAESKTGFANKDRQLDFIAQKRSGQDGQVEGLRQKWQECLNRTLKEADVRTPDGVLVQVDHRSYERQGLDIEPSRKEGPTVTALRRRGIRTDIAESNDNIRARNEQRAQAQAQTEAAPTREPETPLLAVSNPSRKEPGALPARVPEMTMVQTKEYTQEERNARVPELWQKFSEYIKQRTDDLKNEQIGRK